MACHSRTRYIALAVGVRPERRQLPGFARGQACAPAPRTPVARKILEEISNGRMDHSVGKRLRAAPENLLYHVGGGITGFQGQREDPASGRFHFFTPRDEMGPVRALNQDVGQYFGDQFSRSILIEERDRVHRLESRRQLGALASGISGRDGPFSRRTLASVFNARISISPSERACSSSRI